MFYDPFESGGPRRAGDSGKTAGPAHPGLRASTGYPLPPSTSGLTGRAALPWAAMFRVLRTLFHDPAYVLSPGPGQGKG